MEDRPTNNGGGTQRLFIGLLLLTFCLFTTLIVRVKLQEKNSFVGDPYLAARTNLASLVLSPVEAGPLFQEKISAMPIEKRTTLSADEEKKLFQAIYDLVMAFHFGTYEAFRNFRTPVAATFNPQTIEYYKKVLNKFYKGPDENIPDDPESITRLIWERNFGGGAFYHYWTKINTDKASVLVEESTELPTRLMDFARTRLNVGVREIPPTFSLSRTPETIMKEEGKLLFATVYFTVSPADPDPLCPIYLRYFWDGMEKKWLPWQMVGGNAEKRKRDPMF